MLDRRTFAKGLVLVMVFRPEGDKPRRGQPRPDQTLSPPPAAIPLSSTSGIFRGRLVIIGPAAPPGSGLYVYNPAVALGDLLASVAAQPGFDTVGNRVQAPGFFSYSNDGTHFYAAEYAAAHIGTKGIAAFQLNYSTSAAGLPTSLGGLYVISTAGATGQILATTSGVLSFNTTALMEVQGEIATTATLVAIVGGAAEVPHDASGLLVNSFTAGGQTPTYEFLAIGSTGTVRLAGAINSGAINPANTTMFTLPAGYRPAVQKSFQTANNFTATVAGNASVTITSGGAVQCAIASTAGKFVALDGIEFGL